jgi:hypothetical protein
MPSFPTSNYFKVLELLACFVLLRVISWTVLPLTLAAGLNQPRGLHRLID